MLNIMLAFGGLFLVFILIGVALGSQRWPMI